MNVPNRVGQVWRWGREEDDDLIVVIGAPDPTNRYCGPNESMHPCLNLETGAVTGYYESPSQLWEEFSWTARMG